MYAALKKTARPTLFGPLTHAVGKRLDCADHSHGELLFRTGWSASSVIGEGVRFKRIVYNPTAWDFYTLPDELEPAAHAFCSYHQGEDYDRGYMLRFGMPLVNEHPSKWGCIELMGAACGWTDPWRYGPGGYLARCIDVYGSKLVRLDDPFLLSVFPPVFED